ncbi:hypothetical protein SASPL_101427 [Salvia splendens]|uniref:RanBP2-type domain-containing protein n=1 Tax=Salvia splendens TaxID=180675 RepID=A0A8X9ADB9_SALSN|nr:hypothetical protein SASPL_101427 [Salvia splendens]
MNRPGDWSCRSCQHHNFQRRESCQRCGGRKPRAEFITGPDVRPGDWYCAIANCGAHNFASRSTCFTCGATKDERGFDSDLSRGRALGGGAAWKSGDWICTRYLRMHAMSTILRAGWNASGAMRQGKPLTALSSNHVLG